MEIKVEYIERTCPICNLRYTYRKTLSGTTPCKVCGTELFVGEISEIDLDRMRHG